MRAFVAGDVEGWAAAVGLTGAAAQASAEQNRKYVAAASPMAALALWRSIPAGEVVVQTATQHGGMA